MGTPHLYVCFLSLFNFRLAKSTKDWTGKQNYKVYKVILLRKGWKCQNVGGTQIPSDMGTPSDMFVSYRCLILG